MKFGLSSGTGLNLKNASDVDIFQIDEGGNLLNNGKYTSAKLGTFNIIIHTGSTHSAITSANNNVFISCPLIL